MYNPPIYGLPIALIIQNSPQCSNAPPVAWKRAWVPGRLHRWIWRCKWVMEINGTICLITGSGSASVNFRWAKNTSCRTRILAEVLGHCISPIWIKVRWGGFLSLTTLCFMRSGTVVKTSAAKNDSTPKEHGDMVLVKRNSLCQIKNTDMHSTHAICRMNTMIDQRQEPGAYPKCCLQTLDYWQSIICMNIFIDPFKVNHQTGNSQFDSKKHFISWYTPWKFNNLNLKSWSFGSDDILSKKWMMFKFNMLVFGWYASQIQIFWTSKNPLGTLFWSEVLQVDKLTFWILNQGECLLHQKS